MAVKGELWVSGYLVLTSLAWAKRGYVEINLLSTVEQRPW